MNLASAMPAGARGSPAYYSQAMAALPPRPARRRPRLGSLERPVSGRLYRGTWLLVGMPLLIAAFSVRKAEPLPAPQPTLPPAFDRSGTVALATDLAGSYPDRVPGTAGAAGAVEWFSSQLAPSAPVTTKPCSSSLIVPSSHSVWGRAPMNTNNASVGTVFRAYAAGTVAASKNKACAIAAFTVER